MQARTRAFKDWFGDWEKLARIDKLRNSVSVEITGKEIEPMFDKWLAEREAMEELTPTVIDERTQALLDKERAERELVGQSNMGDIKPIGKGAFGDIYDHFKGKAKEAIAFLSLKKGGEAVGALHHKDVGDIDLVWGVEGSGQSDGFGLAKLIKFHPEVIDNLQNILSDMKVVSRTDNRVQLESDTHRASVRLTWDNKSKTWLLTAFEKKETTEPTISRTDVESNLYGKQDDTATLLSSEVSASKDNTEIVESQGIDDINLSPTEAQKEAGNYKKRHLKIDGLDVSIENVKGGVRSGVDADGKEWSITMNNDYGYIRGTKSVDGDHIDIFLSDNPESGNVYVVDQVNKDGSFDEHKVMYGFSSLEEAKNAYLSNYENGWSGLGDITETTKETFNDWVKSSIRKTKPFAEYKVAESSEPTSEAEIKKEADGVRFREGKASEEHTIITKAKEAGTYMKAPNGNPSKLNERQWVQARTRAFKDWFGDWEKLARIDKLRNSVSVEITGKEIEPSDDLKQYKKNALLYGKGFRSFYKNKDTGMSVYIGKSGVKEVLNHDYKNIEQLQSIASIPQIIENSIYIDSRENSDLAKNKDVSGYHYYVCGLKIGGVDYTVRAVIAEQPNGNHYYDHKLSKIEKGKLIDSLSRTTPGINQKEPSSADKDMVLQSLLQTNSSKSLDSNGEPLVMYHGGERGINSFDMERARYGLFGVGIYTTDNVDVATGYSNKAKKAEVYPLYVNARNPIDMNAPANIEQWRDACESLEIGDKFKEGMSNEDCYRILEEHCEYEEMHASEAVEVITDVIEYNMGYDSIVHVGGNYASKSGVEHKVYIVLNPNQVKSATENNGEFKEDNNDIRFRVGASDLEMYNRQLARSEQQFTKATEIVEALISNGYNDFHISRSVTDYGVSTYIQCAFGLKFRISDHMVENNYRLMNEEHIDIDVPVERVVRMVKATEKSFQKRKEADDKAWEESKEQERRVNAKWERIKGNFEGLSFHHVDRTYQNFATFSSRGERKRSNIYQNSLGMNDVGESAYSYEWTEVGNTTGYGAKKPSTAYIESFDEGSGEVVTTRFRDDKKTATSERTGAVAGMSSSSGSLFSHGAGTPIPTPNTHEKHDTKVQSDVDNAKRKVQKIKNEGYNEEKGVTPNAIVRNLGKGLDLTKSASSNSYYGEFEVDGSRVKLRLSTHPANGERMGAGAFDERVSIVVYKDGEHKGESVVSYDEYTYMVGKDTAQDVVKSIVDGVDSLLNGNGFKVNDGVAEKKSYTGKEAEIVEQVSELSDEFGVGVNITSNISEITDESVKRAIEEGRTVKAWFDPKTGSVCIYLPNTVDAHDAMISYVHEVVAHLGMRDMLDDRFESVIEEVYNGMDATTRLKYTEGAKGDRLKATEEYIADVCEEIYNNPKSKLRRAWDNIVGAVRNAFRKLLGLKINDADIRYMLWQSSQRLRGKKKDISYHAQNVALKNEAVRKREVESVGERLANKRANEIVEKMKENAVSMPVLELTRENWLREFGANGIVATPMGEVKMGDNQYEKMEANKRQTQFGMIKPTLTNPDLVIEDSRTSENAERNSMLLFIKTFIKPDGTKYRHFESVSVKKGGSEVIISNHFLRANMLIDKIKAGNVIYNATDLSASSQTLSEYITHANTGVPLQSKDNADNLKKQEFGALKSESESIDEIRFRETKAPKHKSEIQELKGKLRNKSVELSEIAKSMHAYVKEIVTPEIAREIGKAELSEITRSIKDAVKKGDLVVPMRKIERMAND